MSMKALAQIFIVSALIGACFPSSVLAQAKPDFNGSWAQYRGGRGGDPKLAPVAAGPIVLKPQYAKPYEERRAAETAATQRGEPLANASVLCVPYGMPSMMAVAIYPIEIVQTPKQ